MTQPRYMNLSVVLDGTTDDDVRIMHVEVDGKIYPVVVIGSLFLHLRTSEDAQNLILALVDARAALRVLEGESDAVHADQT